MDKPNGSFIATACFFFATTCWCGISYLLRRPATIARIKSRAKYPMTEEEINKWCKTSGILLLITAVCALVTGVLSLTQPLWVIVCAAIFVLVPATANVIYTKRKTGTFLL